MANRPKGYGMTAELQDKKDSKYDIQLSTDVLEWISALVGDIDDHQTPDDGGSENMFNWMKDGVVLCTLSNVLKPGSIGKINSSKMAFKQMENIGNFLSFCEDYGCIKTDMFQTVDLYESQNMPQVINGVVAVGRMAQKKGFDGPTIGAKESDKNPREFTEDQLKLGQKVIGLQMGSNKGASQAGATPYGLGRQIEKTNLKT